MATKSRIDEVSPGAILAEYIGTFSLAFAVLASINGVLGGFISTAAVAGFTVFLAVLTLGQISGAHINPGITIGMYSLKKIDLETMVSYVVAQVAGAFSAVAVMDTLLNGAVITSIAGHADLRVFLGEALGMMFFGIGMAAAVLNKYKGLEAASVVGGSLFLGTMFALVVSNGILNPAVAFAVDSVSWVYLLAPIFGAVIGMNLYSYIRSKK